MSVRLRLTLSYAGFLLVAGVALMALVFYILRFVPNNAHLSTDGEFVPGRNDLLAVLWPRTWQLLLVLAVIGLAGGWFLAGWMLRPLQYINGVARRVAAGSFDHRVQLGGRHDEFYELAETFDLMLDRLQDSFDEQRRFAANAAHELRTPYAIERSMLDVALADPGGLDIERLLRRLDETNRRGIEVVEALLALATIDAGHPIELAPVDVAETVGDAIRELHPFADEAGVTISSVLGEGDIDGSGTLVRHVAVNLILNGIRHNTTDGWVTVRTATAADGYVELAVSNSGPVVAPDLLSTLTEPFIRGVGRVGSRSAGPGKAPVGSGLGLALVARVVDVHGAVLDITARPAGGLDVTVRFPGPGSSTSGR